MFTEDLDAFLNLNEFGVEAVYNSVTIVAQLINDYATIDAGTVGVEGSNPVALVKSSDVAGVAADDPITVDGVSYSIVRIEPDSTGQLLRLILVEA